MANEKMGPTWIALRSFVALSLLLVVLLGFNHLPLLLMD